MNRRVVIALVAALMVGGVIATPASAARSSKFSFSVSGPSADAFWTTFPVDGEPEAGVVYTDTSVSAADNAVVEGGQAYNDKFALVDIFNYKFDHKGNFVFVSETFGVAGGDDVSFTVGSRLSSASLDATIPVDTCTDKSCAPAGTIDVSADWTATGGTVRINGTTKVTGPGFTEITKQKGSVRDARATGSIDGSGLGTSVFADIGDFSFKDTFICHGC